MDMRSKRLDFFPPSFKKCKCKDCYGYEKYVKEGSQVNQSDLQTKSGCKNDLFHQTLVLGETALVSSDYESNSSLADMSEFTYSLETINPAQRWSSTGNIPTIGEGNGAFGKSKSASGFPANYSECSCHGRKTRPIVYVTFASGSKRHEDEVASLCDMCDQAGFAVKCDNYRALQENGELNVHQWRDENFQRADCVLFCISPGYIDIVNSIEDDLASAGENDHEKGAIYIYNLARSELVECCSIDKRFLFVLFTNSGKELNVPQCFSPYTKFKFPGQSETLVKAMQNRYPGSR